MTFAFGGTYSLFLVDSYDLSLKPTVELGFTATGFARELIGWAEQTGQHWLDAELHRVRGELLLRRDPPNVSAAEDAFNRALEIARSATSLLIDPFDKASEFLRT